MPTEIPSQGDISYQDELWLRRPEEDTPAWVQIFGVVTIGMPDRAPEDQDVTHQQSPGRTRETIPGLMASADFTQELQFWPEHESQQMLAELADLTEDGTPEYVEVAMVVGGLTRAYRGYVNTYVPAGTVGEVRMANTTFKLFNRIKPDPVLPEPEGD